MTSLRITICGQNLPSASALHDSWDPSLTGRVCALRAPHRVKVKSSRELPTLPTGQSPVGCQPATHLLPYLRTARSGIPAPEALVTWASSLTQQPAQPIAPESPPRAIPCTSSPGLLLRLDGVCGDLSTRLNSLRADLPSKNGQKPHKPSRSTCTFIKTEALPGLRVWTEHNQP